ncbi:MAG TPA: hypothetical protein VGT41_04785, partial [Candidatus Babeliales bacterium]|nr:hypothetical protein [Candidatus Babeliales bacterium]
LLINGDSTGISDIIYKISLTAPYDSNGQLGTVYNTVTADPQFLDANQQKLVTFSYPLPQAFSGKNLNLHIQAFLKSGTPLGWADTNLSVSGGLPILTVSNGFLTVDGQQYPVDVGPTLYETSTSTTVSIKLSNTNNTAITVTPNIKVYNRTIDNSPLKTYAGDAVTVKANSSVTVTYPLDRFSNKAGVYAGDISFVDANNSVRALDFQYRYIVAGNIITISSITSTASLIKSGDIIPITINYSGSPYDIATGNISGNGSAQLDVKIFNEKDELVGTYSDTTDFNIGSSKNISIKAQAAAQAIRVEVTATQNGTVVATYSTKLSANYDQAKNNIVTNGDNNHMTAIMYGILGVIIVIILIALIIKFASMRRAKVLVALLIIGVTSFFTIFPTAQAYTETGRKSINGVWDYTGYDFVGNGSGTGHYPPNDGRSPNPSYSSGNLPQGYTGQDGAHWHVSGCTDSVHCADYSPQVTINSPGTTDVYAPGQAFNFTGAAYASACINNQQDIAVTATLTDSNGNVIQTANFTYYDVNNAGGTGHYQVEGGTQFSLPHGGVFTAPSTPGTYTLSFRIDSYQNVPGRTLNTSKYANTKDPLTGNKYGSENKTLDPATLGGYVTGTVKVVVVANTPPTVSISANPSTVNSGDSSILTWHPNNADSCTASDGWSGPVSTVDPTSQSVGPLTVATRYTITCKNTAGSASNSVVVNVNPCPVPPQNPVNPTTSDTDSVTPTVSDTNNPNPSDPGYVNPSGYQSMNTNTHASQAAAVLLADNPCGPTSVTPSVSIYANPNPIAYNTASTLTWYSNNADSCTAIAGPGFSTGGLTTNSTGVSTGNLTSAQTFTIDCHNNA